MGHYTSFHGLSNHKRYLRRSPNRNNIQHPLPKNNKKNIIPTRANRQWEREFPNLSPFCFLIRSPVLKLAILYSHRTWKFPNNKTNSAHWTKHTQTYLHICIRVRDKKSIYNNQSLVTHLLAPILNLKQNNENHWTKKKKKKTPQNLFDTQTINRGD